MREKEIEKEREQSTEVDAFHDEIPTWHRGLFQLGFHLREQADKTSEWVTYQLRGGARVAIRLQGARYRYVIARSPKAEGPDRRGKWHQEVAVFAKYFGLDSDIRWHDRDAVGQSIATCDVSKVTMDRLSGR